MNDLISRQAAIDVMLAALDDDWESDYAKDRMCELPSAQPERIRGRWVPITESDCSGYDPVLAGYEDPVVGYVCSVCGDGQEKEVMGEPLWNFCPNCGADMRGEQDD